MVGVGYTPRAAGGAAAAGGVCCDVLRRRWTMARRMRLRGAGE